jgi:hypothetical protein
MVVWAVRTYEPWSVSGVLIGSLVLIGLVALLIFAVQRRNR